MKKSQVVSFLIALVFVFFLGRLSVVAENTGIISQGADTTSTTPAQGTIEDDDGADGGGGSVSIGNATPEEDPPDTTPAPVDPEEELDLGEDLELAEGITDARAQQARDAAKVKVKKDGSYTSKVEVALYIHTYGDVPDNYISKTKARNAGWVSEEGNLWDVLPGMSIGGGGYHNEGWGDEPLLPETSEGRNWHECDINYQGGYRGAERLVYSEDGLVFYTGDHYRSFERLY